MSAETLLEAVRRGAPCDEVLALLEPLSDAQRRACLPELKALRAGMRNRWDVDLSRRTALYVAGAGCHSAASAAAQWLLSREFRWEARRCNHQLVSAVRDRSPDWYRDVAHRIAARPSRAEELFLLIAELSRLAGGPPPTTDGFVRGWVRGFGWLPRVRGGRTVTERLRTDPFLQALVPRLFEAEDAGAALHQFGWAGPLAELAAEGTLKRNALLDGAMARLLRGDRAANLRFFRDLIAALAPDDDELAAYGRDWVRLAADAAAPVAGDAQAALRRLWAAGRLGPEQLAEASRGVLFRTERKLVRGQLVLLGKAMTRDKESVEVLLPAVTEAFGHADSEVQERALKLVARHTGKADPGVRAEVAAAAGLLGPSLRRRAAGLLGAEPDPGPEEPYEELLPPVPEPRRSLPPQSLDELVEEAAAVSGRSWRPESSEAFERVLDGLVRYAHQHRPALASALRPVWERHHVSVDWLRRHAGRWGLAEVVCAVLEEVSYGRLRAFPLDSEWAACPHSVRIARVREAALGIASGRLPMLLATPDWESGALEPETLVDRLRAFGRLGLRPAPVDFEQALLRVRPDAGWAAAAAQVGTAEGERLAAWLASGGLPAPASERVALPERVVEHSHWYRTVTPRRALVRDEGFPALLEGPFQEPFRRVGAAHAPAGTRYGGFGGEARDWLAVLPWHREAAAARRLAAMAAGADSDIRGPARELPALAEAEADGVAGPALHLALAYGLGARDAEDRLAAVDALLVLAARGQLGTDALGGELGTLVEIGSVKPNRLANALRSAAETGAYRTAWAVLRPVLPVVLAGESPHRGAGELLEVAADCVERCGDADGSVVGLDAAASGGGSTRRGREARRLQEALRAA